MINSYRKRPTALRVVVTFVCMFVGIFCFSVALNEGFELMQDKVVGIMKK